MNEIQPANIKSELDKQSLHAVTDIVLRMANVERFIDSYLSQDPTGSRDEMERVQEFRASTLPLAVMVDREVKERELWGQRHYSLIKVDELDRPYLGYALPVFTTDEDGRLVDTNISDVDDVGCFGFNLFEVIQSAVEIQEQNSWSPVASQLREI